MQIFTHHLIIMKTPFTKIHWAAQLHGLCTNQFNRKHIGNKSNSSCKSFLVQVPADFRYFPLETIPEILLHKGTSGWCPPSHWLTMGHHLVRMIAQFTSWASHCTLHMHSPVGSTNTDDRSPQPTQSCSDLTSVGAIQMANSCIDLKRINH